MRMYVVIAMSLDQYDALLRVCSPKTREFIVLKNGLIFRRPDGDRFIEIYCLESDSRRLLDLACALLPDVVPTIENALASPRRDFC